MDKLNHGSTNVPLSNHTKPENPPVTSQSSHLLNGLTGGLVPGATTVSTQFVSPAHNSNLAPGHTTATVFGTNSGSIIMNENCLPNGSAFSSNYSSNESDHPDCFLPYWKFEADSENNSSVLPLNNLQLTQQQQQQQQQQHHHPFFQDNSAGNNSFKSNLTGSSTRL